MLFSRQKSTMIEPERALRGRDRAVLVDPTFHEIFGIPVQSVPTGSEVAYFALGCFWGRRSCSGRRRRDQHRGRLRGRFTPNPTYEEVCSARTGHTEIVKVSYDAPRPASRRCSSSSSRTTTRRRGCARATTWDAVPVGDLHHHARAAGHRRACPRRVPDRVHPVRLRPDHHRGQAGPGLLLRRGLPPAVPGQEPLRLLPGARHRRDLQRVRITSELATAGPPRVGRPPGTAAAGPARPSPWRPGRRSACGGGFLAVRACGDDPGRHLRRAVPWLADRAWTSARRASSWHRVPRDGDRIRVWSALSGPPSPAPRSGWRSQPGSTSSDLDRGTGRARRAAVPVRPTSPCLAALYAPEGGAGDPAADRADHDDPGVAVLVRPASRAGIT